MLGTEEEIYEALGLNPEETPTQETPPEELGAGKPTEQEPAAEEPGEEPAEEPREEQIETPEGEPRREDPLEKLRRELTEQHRWELEKLQQDHKAENDAWVAGLGMVDPYNGNQPITTREQYDAYQQRHQDAQWDSIAQQTGMSRDALDRLIADHPEVRKGIEAQAAARAAREEAEQQALRQKLDADVAAIAAVCPEITDLESLVNHPSYSAVAAKMRQIPGLGVADAFFLVNRDNLPIGKADANAQRVRNNLAGKGHLHKTAPRGEVAPIMTREQEQMYRKLLPNATRAEILKFHQENTKGA